jgi:ESS family glutamate:Na+ symporter
MIVVSFAALCVLLWIGVILRMHVRLFQKLFLPAPIIAGLIGLLLVQVLQHYQAQTVIQWTTAGWSKLPGFLINIVFAGLFLGVNLPNLKKVWKIAGPQLVYGQIIVWGQYAVGLGLVLLVLGRIFGIGDIFGVIIPVGFEGGHGTAGGLKETFTHFNWKEGTDLCLASATIGIISAIIVGMVLINWAIRRGYVTKVTALSNDRQSAAGYYPTDNRPVLGYHTIRQESADTLSFHLAMLGLAVVLGYLMKSLLIYIQHVIPALEQHQFFQGFPLFPLCMIGGLIVQSVVRKTKRPEIIDHGVMQSWSGAALDFLIIAAIATIRIETIRTHFAPFIILIIAGIVWNVVCVVFLARKLLPNYWFERSIAEMGQSMGVTATGLLLLRAVDPRSETDAPAAFAYKQLLHEPFMGGGLWTSSAIPLIIILGTGWPVFWISLGAIAVWLIIWRLLFYRR